MPVIRAAVHRSVGGPLAVETVELAHPMPDELRIEVEAVAVCHSDVAFLDGDWPADLPAVWGHEAAGTVVEVGDGVTAVGVGDRVTITSIRACGACRNCRAGLSVACTTVHPRDERTPLHTTSGEPLTWGLRMAAFAEQVIVHESQVSVVPADMPAPSAALLGCGVISGYCAVTNTAAVEPGASVVVVGTGGVGIHTVQGAAHAGAGPIVAVDLDEEKRSLALRLGATDAVDPRDDAPGAVAAATGGRMADYVFVTTGAPAAFEGAIDLVAPGGALVVVGMPPTGVDLRVDAGTFAGLNQRILGSKLGGTTVATDIPALVRRYADGELELDGLVTATYPLEGIADAVADSRRGHTVRAVVVMDGDAA
ncbi:MAG: zinc-binding dehydrogenase [Acidimicrobiia bacterium]|nr:zinc-binding dehydrogenase [Acidimicrobiia bacterium]